jgi:hypothetical protein
VNRTTRYRRCAAAGLVLMLAACSGGQTTSVARNTGLYLLIDTSGTYNRQVTKAEQIILVALSKLQPTDSFAVARIDTASFTEKNIIAKATFDDRPSTCNQQKRAFASRIEKFIDDSTPAPYTDITGGLLQAIEYLKEKNPGHKEILIFSDMKEDLAKGYVRNIPLDLKGFDVVALNVTKLRTDNFDPREYMARLDTWKSKIEAGGGHFRVINDIDRLDGLL